MVVMVYYVDVKSVDGSDGIMLSVLMVVKI